MASKAEQIAARVAALLLNTTDAVARVYRDREDALTREESPAIVVEIVDEDSTPLGGGSGPFRPTLQTDADTLRLAVIVAVRGAAWQTQADAVRVQVHALIVGDAALREVASDLRRDRCEWKAASADQPFGYAAQIYLFKYHTRASALDSTL